jgi:RNA polymerase sigma factor (sigma-70 family)
VDEKLLIQALQKGDQVAFSQLIDLYQDKVYSCAIGMLQHAEDAEDVAQEVFIEVYRAIPNFKGESALGTWIYRITVNKVLEFQRKKQRKKRFGFLIPIFGGEEEQTVQVSDFHHPGIALEQQELSSVLFKAINELPERQKTAFLLHKLEQQSYQEICEIMELSLSSVESILFRAKKNLQNLLGHYYKEFTN